MSIESNYSLEHKVVPCTSAAIPGMCTSKDNDLIDEEFRIRTVGKYSIIPSLPHIKGVKYLNRLGKEPLNVDEILRARLEQAELYDYCFWSGTGIAYKAKTSSIKILQRNIFLRQIPSGFRGDCITCFDFDYLEAEVLDLKQFNSNSQTKKEISSSPIWLALAGGDKKLLKKYVNSTFAGYEKKYNKKDKLMSFCKIDKTMDYQLRAIFIGSLFSTSYVSGDYSLNAHASFLFLK